MGNADYLVLRPAVLQGAAGRLTYLLGGMAMTIVWVFWIVGLSLVLVQILTSLAEDDK